MEIYLLRGGKETGPFDWEAVEEMYRRGEIGEMDYGWRSGLVKWERVGEFLRVGKVTGRESGVVEGVKAEELPTFGTVKLAEAEMVRVEVRVEESKKEALTGEERKVWQAERAIIYQEFCQSVGVEYFTKVSKAHCLVVIGYLDERFPDWDGEVAEASRRYFFPALAEKFPQLVVAGWRGKLRFEGEKKKVATGGGGKAWVGWRAVRSISWPPVGRAVVLGGILVGMGWFVFKLSVPAVGKRSGASIGLEAKAGGDGATVVAKPEAVLVDPLGGGGTVVKGEADPKMVEGLVPGKVEAVGGGGVVVDPLAPSPSPVAVDPLAPAPSPVVVDPLAPAPRPVVVVDPVVPSLPVAVVPPAEVVAVVKSVLKLTKPFEFQLAYGKVRLPVGTSVKFLSREGEMVKVDYLKTILTVPIGSTDYGIPELVPGVAVPAKVPAVVGGAGAGDL